MNTSDTLWKARLFLEQKNYRKAEEQVKIVLSQDINDSSAYCLLATALSGQERYREAEDAIRRSLELDPADADAFHVKSIIEFEQHKYSAAQRSIETALRIDPDHDGYYGHLAAICFNRRARAESEAAIQKGLAINPNNHYLLDLKAKLLFLGNKKESAAEYVGKSLAEDPLNIHAMITKGYMHLASKEYPEAEECFATVLRQQPDMEAAKDGLVDVMLLRSSWYAFIIKFGFRKYYIRNWIWFAICIIAAIQALPFMLVVFGCYLVICWYFTVWYEIILSLGRRTRYLLTPPKIKRRNVFLVMNAVSAVTLITAMVIDADITWKLAIYSFGLIFPVIGYMDLSPGNKYGIMALIFAGIIALGGLLALGQSLFLFTLIFTALICLFGILFSFRAFGF